MSYATFIAQSNSAKQALVEIDIGESSMFVNSEPGIWANTYSVNEPSRSFGFGSGAFGFGAFGTGGTATLSNGKGRKQIGSLWVDGEYYTRRFSLADARTNEKSFYYDMGPTMLYVHFDDGNPPSVFDFIQIGVTHGYSDKAGYWNDSYYDGRLLAVPNITRRKDPMFWGIVRFEGGTIEFANQDGEFDHFAVENMFGQPCRILFGGSALAYTEFAKVFEGIVEDFRLEGGVLSLDAQDKRKALSRKVPVNHFAYAEYPNMESFDYDKPIPLAYGVIRSAPVICTNGGATASTYYFKLCDTNYHNISELTTVYVEGSSGIMAVKTPADVDLALATFSLSSGIFEPGREVVADFTGFVNASANVITNGLDIIADLLANYAGVSYDSANYDTTEWGAATAGVASMGLFIERETELFNAIGDICKSIPGTFIVKDDGRYTFKKYNAAGTAETTIRAMELLGPPAVGYESDEYISSALVKYGRDWAGDDWSTAISDARENELFQRYKTRRQETFETLLTGSAAAAAFGTTMIAYSGEIQPTFTVTTKTQNIGLELEDVVDLEAYVFADGTYGTVRCEVIGVEKNLSDYTVTLTLRRIQDVTANLSAATIIKWEAI